ncbi:MAG TPA: glycosyltransferase family 2 protein [Ruminiclostridium sp.]|nr:glycosyltransferase family 2 protein [Ruminiclostridium sp.]
MIWYNFFIQIWLLFNFLTTTFCLYQVVIAIAGLHKNKKFDPCPNKRRFAAIIAARNEEAVIANLIESLKKQNYPNELLDIVVVADNCTDNTAKVAKAAGAIVYERYNKVEVGKGFVLKFIFGKLIEERDIYDAFCIFDADNVVDKEFFNQMNSAIESGCEVAQGYRDMKNPSDSWVSGGHSLFYWMENRFFNSARSCLGLSATINGTGFMVTASLIKEIGYNTYTCTEDIEFSVQSVLAGRRVGWVPNAVVYDEQPVTLSQSMRQRLRWTNGLIQCFWRYIGPLSKRIIDRPDWVSIDLFMYLVSFPAMIFGMLAAVMSVFFVILRIFDPMGSLINFILLALGTFVGCWFIGLLTLIMEKKISKDMLTSVLAYPIFNILWVAIYVMCMFKKKVDWKPIVHVRNISISDIESKSKV